MTEQVDADLKYFVDDLNKVLLVRVEEEIKYGSLFFCNNMSSSHSYIHSP